MFRISGRVVVAGTWSSPNTVELAAKMVRVFRRPIMANGRQTPRVLYDIMGDDGLYDDIADAVRPGEGPYDIRHLVANHLEKWMYEGCGTTSVNGVMAGKWRPCACWYHSLRRGQTSTPIIALPVWPACTWANWRACPPRVWLPVGGAVSFPTTPDQPPAHRRPSP